MAEQAAEVAAPAPKTAQYVVTSENRAEFMDKRLDITKPAEKVVAPDTKDKELEIPVLGEKKEMIDGETVTKGEVKEAKTEEKKDHPIKERFSEMAAKRREAEATAKAEREAREKAERELAELKAKAAPPPPEPAGKLGPEPKRDQFKTDEEYLDARVAYAVKKSDIEKAAATEKARVEAETNKTLSEWQSRLTKARETIKDFDEKIDAGKDMVFSNQVRDAIFESPKGPEILYYFVDHRDEAEALKGMSVLSAIRFIGRLEADLTPKEKAATSAPKTEVAVSKAPAPISPLKGSSAPEELVDSAGKFKGDFKQFKRLRKEGKL